MLLGWCAVSEVAFSFCLQVVTISLSFVSETCEERVCKNEKSLYVLKSFHKAIRLTYVPSLWGLPTSLSHSIPDLIHA